MIRLFIKLYTFIYVSYLRIVKRNQFVLKGKIKADRFFRIELARNSTLFINGDIHLQSHVFIAVRKNAQLTIGDSCFFNRFCSIVCRDKIRIGDNCMFGESVKVYDHDHAIEPEKASRIHYTTNTGTTLSESTN